MLEELKSIISEKLGIPESELTPDTDMRRDHGINSIELAEIVLELEDRYECEIDDKEISKRSTLREIAEYLEKELA